MLALGTLSGQYLKLNSDGSKSILSEEETQLIQGKKNKCGRNAKAIKIMLGRDLFDRLINNSFLQISWRQRYSNLTKYTLIIGEQETCWY